MVDVLLINPSFDPHRQRPTIRKNSDMSSATLPLAILYLASYLQENGLDVKCVDTRLYRTDEALQKIRRYLNDVSLVGLSVMTATIPDALRITDFIKSYDSLINVVWGGIHPTLFPEQTVNDRSIDFVIVREGEVPLLELASYLKYGKPRIETIPNLYYKNERTIVANKKMGFLDVDKLPFPAYDLLDIERYITRLNYDGELVRVLETQTSRGCPHRCSFCVNAIVNKQIWRMQTSDKVINNIGQLINRYKLDHIVFLDENLFPSKKRSEAIIKGLINYDIKWLADCRADYFSKTYIDNSFLGLMKKSGCEGLFIGAESGSQRMLNILKKDITVQDVVNAVRCCARYNIKPLVAFMLGLPNETKEDLLKTLRLMWLLKKENPRILWSGPQLFRPYPGGELYKLCKERGLIEPKTLRQWSNQLTQNRNFASYIDTFPWIKDEDTINFVLDAFIYMNILNFAEYPKPPHLKRIFLKIPADILSKLIKLRWSYNFWRIPIEARIIRALTRVTNLREWIT